MNNPQDNNGPVKCQGETFFGKTIQSCDQPATHVVPYQYAYCERHYIKATTGQYPEDIGWPKPKGRTLYDEK